MPSLVGSSVSATKRVSTPSMRFDEGSPPELVVDVVAGVVLNEEDERSAVPVPRLRICWGILRAPGVCGQLGTDWSSGDSDDEEDDEFGEEGEEEADADEELAAAATTTTKRCLLLPLAARQDGLLPFRAAASCAWQPRPLLLAAAEERHARDASIFALFRSKKPLVLSGKRREENFEPQRRFDPRSAPLFLCFATPIST